ncbi:cytochrome P450 4V2 [Caerostris extrusa]|uniref:Cytochrome P450 4V2 n=1 Tax=Caerostris extrusa TaxID=172846 RepID=A0AAV4PLW5_CAEEX|nr:cytochrome P450 4V2 [Caerostris extrusa]
MTSCTLDVICQTAMGVSINAQSGENRDYVKAIHDIGNTFMYRGFRPWLYPEVIFYRTTIGKNFKANLQCIQGLTRNVMKQKKAEMASSDKNTEEMELNTNDNCALGKKRKAFLELLLELHLQDPSFTEEDVREEVDTFMFAGHDTTAMALSWSLYCLGLYPDIQKTAREELDAIFGNDPKRGVVREDLMKMKYLECVIKETLRLYPAVPMFSRECNESFTVLGHTVHPGTMCFIFAYALHRDPEVFPEPEKFDPTRFFPENSKGRHPYAYIPFSAGSRNCIGQKFAMLEMKTVLAHILRRFHITSLDQRDKVVVYPNITLRNVNPLRLHFQLR